MFKKNLRIREIRMKLKMIKHIAFTILFLLGMVSAAWAATEDLIPTSFDTSGGWVGTAADIDDPTIDTSDYVYATTQNQASTGNSFSDPVSVQIQIGDTINSVTAYINSQLTGTPGDEWTELVITCTSGSDTLNTGSNGTWTTDSQALTNCVNYYDLAGATFTLTSRINGGSGVNQYQVAEVWLRIDYTPAGNDPECRGLTPADITVCASGCDHTTIADAFSNAVQDDVICVYGTGSYPGFTFPSTGITLVSESIVNRPHLTGTITFNAGNPNGPYTNGGAVLDGFIIDSNSPSMYMKGWCDSTSVTIGNDVQIKNTLFDGGGKPAIKWEGGCPTIGPGNTFRNKLRTALRIYTNAGHSGKAAIIQGNEFYGNGIDGGGSPTAAYAEIHTETDATAGRYILIKDNYIHNSAYASGFGIAAGSDDNLHLTGNVVVDNPFAGFKLGTWGNRDDPDNPHTGQITISGETNYTFAGTGYTDGSPNKFYSNDRGGIVTSVVSTFSIIKNEIYDNGWGGIHTGWLEPVDGEFTWPGGSTPALMTIRKNKVYGNGTGTDTAGGGIDVMYASGTIENNLVYENKYAGIRVGDGAAADVNNYCTALDDPYPCCTGNTTGTCPTYMTIRHNTVVDNGGGTTPDQGVAGGGIVYHDGYAQDGTTPCYYCRPYGTIPLSINVKDNVIAYTSKAALAGMGFTNTVGSEERDYNLIYSNNPGAWFWSADCGYPDSMEFKCVIGQYGFDTSYYWDKGNDSCTASVSPYPCCTGAGTGTCLGDDKLKLTDPNDILDDPLFTDRANDDYTLTGSSPGSGTASDSGDKGAWGGSYPIDW